MKRPVPRTVPGWVKEINLTIADARGAEPFGELIEDEEIDPEFIEMERQDDLRRSAADLLLVERAKEWLLGDGD